MKMHEVLTVEDIYDLLAAHSGEDPLKPQALFPGRRGAALRFTIFCFCICIILSILVGLLPKPHRWVWMLIFGAYLIGSCSALVLSIGNVIAGLKQPATSAKRPVPNFLLSKKQGAQRDFKLVRALQLAPLPNLSFVKTRLQDDTEHLRTRIGFVIGAVDKVGFVTLIAGGIVSSTKFVRETHIPRSLFEVGIAFFGICYAAGTALLIDCQRIDDMIQLLDCAIQEIRKAAN